MTRTGRPQIQPHLDPKKEARRTYNREYMRRRRSGLPQAPAPKKPPLTNAQRVAASRARRKALSLPAAAPTFNRHQTIGPHFHTCITPDCKRRYRCINSCDPVDEGLKNSICDDCFDRELSQI